MSASLGIRPALKNNVEEALRLFAIEAEWPGLNVDETELVLEEALKCYGSVADASQIRSLFGFYRRYLGMADVGRRQALLTRITEFVSEGRQNRYLALLCFLNADTDGQIISGAALDISMVMPMDAGDPLTGPKHVATHGCGGLRAKMGGPRSDDEGHAAAGLLLLGDMRLLSLLEEIWERLSPEGRRRMVKRRSNLATALAVEFLLRRLEADKDEEYHGELGAFLFNLPEIASKQPINALLDIRRNFGLPSGLEPMELIGKETMSEAFARIRTRLKALVDRESEPKVLASTYAAWAMAAGVEPESSEAGQEEPEEESEPDADGDDDSAETFPDILSEELHAEFNLWATHSILRPKYCSTIIPTLSAPSPTMSLRMSSLRNASFLCSLLGSSILSGQRYVSMVSKRPITRAGTLSASSSIRFPAPKAGSQSWMKIRYPLIRANSISKSPGSEYPSSPVVARPLRWTSLMTS